MSKWWGERLRAVVPHVSLSHEINPEAREYERASSTAYNAAAMPIAVDYLAELERRLPLGDGLQVFHSAGGMVPVAVAKRRPIVMAMSGPAAGVAASVRIARELGRNRVLTFDMGGTTTDVCLIVDGAAEMADSRMAGDRPLRQPMLAVHSIGAGGGSIVQMTPGGLTVGPQSAGAEPGPACYGLGGTQATVTDANLLLGLLDPAVRLGNRITLDPALAERAVAPIAAALGMGLTQTALGIVQVANATMARALRRVTVERGIDGRDCTLLAFGGGGPMHAAGLAALYGIAEVVVPPRLERVFGAGLPGGGRVVPAAEDGPAPVAQHGGRGVHRRCGGAGAGGVGAARRAKRDGRARIHRADAVRGAERRDAGGVCHAV